MSWRIAVAWVPSLPHTVGPIPWVGVSPTTTPAAPSAKMKQLLRSVMSTVGDSFSDPSTSTLPAVPPRTMSAATPSA